MNRVTRRIIANKDFSKFRFQANNAFSAFKGDVQKLSSQFMQLSELFEENDAAKIFTLIDDMVSRMDVLSTDLSIIRNNIQKELAK